MGNTHHGYGFWRVQVRCGKPDPRVTRIEPYSPIPPLLFYGLQLHLAEAFPRPSPTSMALNIRWNFTDTVDGGARLSRLSITTLSPTPPLSFYSPQLCGKHFPSLSHIHSTQYRCNFTGTADTWVARAGEAQIHPPSPHSCSMTSNCAVRISPSLSHIHSTQFRCNFTGTADNERDRAGRAQTHPPSSSLLFYGVQLCGKHVPSLSYTHSTQYSWNFTDTAGSRQDRADGAWIHPPSPHSCSTASNCAASIFHFPLVHPRHSLQLEFYRIQWVAGEIEQSRGSDLPPYPSLSFYSL